MSLLAQKTILLVEDDEADVELTRRAFEFYGFDARVETAADGHEALERLRCGPLPDLVLTDIKMPRVNGLELQERLRADERLRQLPVVFLTSSSERADLEHALLHGARAYLQKPMELAQFEAVVAELRRALGA